MTDNITNAIISKYLKYTELLIKRFYDIYYSEWEPIYWNEWDIVWIQHGPWTVNISDEYWDINDIFVALNSKIDSKTLFDWYEYKLNFYSDNLEWHCTNLYTYNKKKWKT